MFMEIFILDIKQYTSINILNVQVILAVLRSYSIHLCYALLQNVCMLHSQGSQPYIFNKFMTALEKLGFPDGPYR